jgi:hypothetical protein
MWMQTRAVTLLLDMYRDLVLLAMLPLGMVSLCTYVLSGVLFVLALPSSTAKRMPISFGRNSPNE